MDFYRLPESAQVARLAQLARNALARWGLQEAVVELAAYRENTTFSVQSADKGRFALRVHQANYRTDRQIQSELDFMAELRAHGILTPEIVPTLDGVSFATVGHEAVPEARQCDLFEWIEGKPIRAALGPSEVPPTELARIYRQLGRQAASIHQIGAAWQRPAGFDRPAWDIEGMLGVRALIGDFRKLKDISDAQRDLLLTLAAKLSDQFAAFGQTPDRYGLLHGDFLPENIFVCRSDVRLLDFDDTGEGWFLFEIATALLDLVADPEFDTFLAAMIAGYRERCDLPDDHLTVLPGFFLARAITYLGWAASRTHLDTAAEIKPLLLFLVETLGPEYLADRPILGFQPARN